MPANIDLFPAELLLAIIKCVFTVGTFRIYSEQAIFFMHQEILPLSQVNRQLRSVCLPQLYKHVVIVITPDDVSQSRAGKFELFKRIMERKPHLAEFIRYVDLYHWRFETDNYEIDSLAFLPNLSTMKFPDNLVPDPHLLSVIASHPRLSIAHWDEMVARDVSFLISPSSPPAALSRIHIDNAFVVLKGDNNNHVYSSTGDISVDSLIIDQKKLPQELSLTFSNLSRVHIRVEIKDNPLTPQPLWWFTSFVKRHPQLTCIEITFWPCDHALIWNALKDVHILTSFYDAVHRWQLFSSFSFVTFTASRQAVTDDPFVISTAGFVLFSEISDVVRCIGSCLPPLHSLVLNFGVPRDFPPIFVGDLVSILHQNLPSHSHLHLRQIGRVIPAYRYDSSSRRKPLCMALAWHVASGMPKLERIDVSDGEWMWKYSVNRSQQGEVQIVEVDVE